MYLFRALVGLKDPFNDLLIHRDFISLLLPFLIFLCHTRTVLGYEDPRLFVCDDTSNYNSNSTFATNLAQLLDTLASNTASTGFNATTTAGNSSDPVTALALCRGGVNPTDCQICVNEAALGVRRVCPSQKSAQVWYNLCVLRYSSVNFINKPNNTIAVTFTASREITDPDSDTFDPVLEFLIHNLSATAVESGMRYAVGRSILSPSGNLTLYGYVDCTRDIYSSDCQACLQSAKDEMRSCCSGGWFGWIVTPSCNLQFNMYASGHTDWVNAPWIGRAVINTSAPPPAWTEAVGVGIGGVRYGLALKISLGVIVAVIVAVGVLWVIINLIKRRERGCENKTSNAEETMRREVIGMRNFLYDLDMLVAATDNFSPLNLLGRGGFGIVYKGKMPDGEEIAVKKLAAGPVQGIGEFFNEVKVLWNMQHRNLVRLLGCCVQGEERMLIYEYLPNKSLDTILFDKNKSAVLDWPKRYNIILGVARGLLYLHVDSLLKIVHRDIKASNILLDEQMNPKIADFGLAKLFDDQQSFLRTLQIAGTYGYMAPEYANQGFLSVKSDVFSFGVLILEIVSGRKNYEVQFEEEQQELLCLTWRLEKEGRLIELADVTMGSFPKDIVLRCIRIGLLCCQECIRERPTMSSALEMLSSNSVTVPRTGRPAFQGSRVFAVDQPSSGGVASKDPENSLSTDSTMFDFVSQLIGRD